MSPKYQLDLFLFTKHGRCETPAVEIGGKIQTPFYLQQNQQQQ
jgi:hypothetical protein